MSSFVFDSFYFGFKFQDGFNLENAAKIAASIKELVGPNFEESIQRVSEDGVERTKIYLDEKNLTNRIAIDETNLAILSYFVNDEAPAKHVEHLKDLVTKIVATKDAIMPQTFESLYFRASGFYVPAVGDTEKEPNSYARTLAIMKKLLRRDEKEDLIDASLLLKTSEQYGVRDTSHKVAQNRHTKLMVLEMGVGLFISIGKPITAKEVPAYLKEKDLLDEINGERTKIDKLA